jgi:AcrR family transcriptional regulator
MAAGGEVAKKPQENRRGAMLDSAARSFARKGYDGTSIRDIAADVGVQPSSLYYFFRSKDDLYEAVYERGVEQILSAVEQAIGTNGKPWRRFELAAVAHLEALLINGDYNALVANIVPRGDTALDKRLIQHRDRYETLFIELIDDLPLPLRTDRKVLRLTILSALNGVASWYRPGDVSPENIALKIVGMFRLQLDADAERQDV